jgi:hypothetical protein
MYLNLFIHSSRFHTTTSGSELSSEDTGILSVFLTEMGVAAILTYIICILSGFYLSEGIHF